MENFQIKSVEYYTQIDNKKNPYITCYNTSNGIGMAYCLKSIGKDKTAIGCSPNVQIEDYIEGIIYDAETYKWMKNNTGTLGSWIWKYKRRTIAKVQEYAFNRLMNEHGFKMTFHTDMTYDIFCKTILETKLPIILHGNFKSVSRIGGHIVTGLGFNKKNLKDIILHDPFGNALKGYPRGESKGEYLAYPIRFFDKGKGKMWAQVIEKI